MSQNIFPPALQGQTVLVVGGTSGIGLSAAIQAQAAGATVIVTGQDADRSATVAAQYGFDYRAFDATRAEQIEPALAGIARVDHLVLMAGSFVAGKTLEADVPYLRRAFDERLWATIHILRTLDQRLAPDASVTLISGMLADRPNAHGTAVLAAACAAMEAFARGLALELAPRRVNTLSPGPIDTPLISKALGAGQADYISHLQSILPLHRLGTAEEAGNAVLFLMTNRYMNGATLNIDGGARLV